MSETYLTPEEAAARYKLKVGTVRKWLRQGKLKGFKVAGTLWRISEAELERFINGGEGPGHG
jgi:excisionase family DNA binding protein